MSLSNRLVCAGHALLMLASSAPVAGASWVRLADTSTMAPDSPGVFTHFDAPSHRDGKLVFRAESGGSAGIYSHTDAEGLTLISRAGVPAVGGFDDYGSSPDTSNGDVVFYGTGTTTGAIPFSGIYLHNGTSTIEVAVTGMARPGGSGTFESFGTSPRIRDGRVAYVGRGQGIAGLYLYQGGTSQLIVNHTMSMPGHTENFWIFDEIDFDGADVIFRARSGSNFGGIYRWSAGLVTRVMDQNQLRPGDTTPFGLPFPRFAASNGSVVFQVEGGIFRSSITDGLSNTILIGETAPGSSEQFNALHQPLEIDGLAALTYASTPFQVGVYLAARGNVWPVLNNASTFDGRHIYTFAWSNQSFQDGKMAMYVQFLDDSRGIYLAPDVHIPVGAWFSRSQPIRTAGAGGFQALLYNYQTSELSATPYAEAPAPYVTGLDRGQWTGSYFYDYSSGTFSQATYRFAHHLP